MTNIHNISELNNNSIFLGNGNKQQLPDSIIDSKTDIGTVQGLYKNDDGPFTIYKNPGECPPVSVFRYFLPSCLIYLTLNLERGVAEYSVLASF